MGPDHSTRASKRAFLCVAFLLLAGCNSMPPKGCQEACEIMKNVSALHESNTDAACANPCGCLHIRKPLVNVTGFLTAGAKPNATLYLFVTPETSLGASLFVIQNCTPIFRKTLTAPKQFSLGPMPAGEYVVMLSKRSFAGAQGFPIVREINESGLAVQMIFQGGDMDYSISAFSIHPIQPQAAESRSNGSQVNDRESHS